jgi:hypothetical protein
MRLVFLASFNLPHWYNTPAYIRSTMILSRHLVSLSVSLVSSNCPIFYYFISYWLYVSIFPIDIIPLHIFVVRHLYLSYDIQLMATYSYYKPIQLLYCEMQFFYEYNLWIVFYKMHNWSMCVYLFMLHKM